MHRVIPKQHTTAEDRKRFAALAAYEILDTPAEPGFDAIAELAAAVCNVPMAAIVLFAEERQWFKAAYGLGELREISADAWLCHSAMNGINDLYEINNLHKNPQFAAHPMVIDPPRLRYYASMPLITPEGYCIGSLCVIDQQPRTLTDLQHIALKQLAGVVMRLLEAHKAEQHLIRIGRLLECSDDGICVMDAATLHFEYANEKAQIYLGHPLSALRKMTAKELQPTAQLPEFQAAIQPLYFDEKVTVAIEATGLRNDGTTFPAEVRLQLWRDGVQPKLIAVFKDITQRKQAQQALTMEGRHLQAIIDAVPDCIKLISQEGTLLNMTPAGLAMLEVWNLAEIRSKQFVDFVEPEYRPAFHELHSRVFQGFSDTLEFEVAGLKGKRRWLETHAAPLRDEEGKVVSLLGATRDISARKQAELEQALLASIVQHSDDAIISTTSDGTITSWNRGAEKLFSLTRAEAIGQSILLSLSQAEAEEVRQFFDNLIEIEYTQRYETQHRRKDGRVIDVAMTVSPIKDKQGSMIGISWIVRDITVQKQTERGLLDARQHLEDKVLKTEAELQGAREESQEINSALNVLLRRRESDKSGAKIALTKDVESTITPFMKQLRRSVINQHQVRLLDALEGNLQSLVHSYGHANNLSVAYQRLSQVEAQVASMVRQGLSTKVIATTLKVSTETVSTHRKNIRKKLISGNQNINLSSFLKALTEDD